MSVTYCCVFLIEFLRCKFGKPLLNNALRLDHAQLQKRSGCCKLGVICQYVAATKLYRCYGRAGKALPVEHYR